MMSTTQRALLLPAERKVVDGVKTTSMKQKSGRSATKMKISANTAAKRPPTKIPAIIA
jgi:hypothetical protein